MRLEPVCCKKRPKIVPDQLLVWRIRKGPLKVLNGTKLILDDHGNNSRILAQASKLLTYMLNSP